MPSRYFPAILSGLLALILAITAATTLRADDGDPFETAHEHLQKGRYAEALDAFDSLTAAKADPVRIAVGRSRALTAEGKYEEAVAVLTEAEQASPRAPDLPARRARILLLLGRYSDAEAAVDQALKLDGKHPRARLVQADLFTETGHIKEANEGYRWFIRYYNAAQPTDAETLMLIARGAVQYARWNSVSQIFSFAVNTLCPDALKDDDLSWQSYHVSGSLLLEKYNRAQAIPELKKALAINPRATDVLVALADAAFQQHDIEAAGDFVDQALKVNPQFAPALHVKADILIAAGKLGEAAQRMQETLNTNPNDQRTLARIAAVYLLLDGLPEPERLEALLVNLDAIDQLKLESPTRFESLVIELAGRNPRPGYFLSVLGETLESRRKFDAAEKFYQRAISLMPQLAEPKTKLGMLYMRIGRTDDAATLLDDAFKSDPYHVRVSNMRKVLKLLEGYETIATDHFVIRVDSELDKVLGEYMAEYLEEIYPELTKQFGFEPPHRTQFEIYNKSKGLSAHQWFSARMVGLPWIQTIGASTGVIVALASPTASPEPFNWARVLRHEYVHVITLQQTDFNIPHWFTEALAVTSEGYPRPAIWNQLLKDRVPKGELRSLDELNEGFIRPRSSNDWQFAYCQSRLYAQYMIEKYGPETIPAMLEAYRNNTPTDAAIPKVFNVDKETFERGYREFLDKIVEEIQGGPVAAEKSLADLEKAHRADPEDVDASGAYALALLKLRRRSDARDLAETALKADPSQPDAALVIAQLELLAEDHTSAVKVLEPALDRDAPHPLVLELLAKIKLLDQRNAEAAALYELGRKKFPHDADWLKGMAAAYLRLDETDKLRVALRDIAAIEPDDVSVRRKLAEMALEEKDFAAAIDFGRQAIYIDVLDADIHRILGEAYLGAEKSPRALREFRVALQLKPNDTPIELALVRALIAAEMPDQAREHLNSILTRDPDNAEAATLRNQLP